MTLQFILGYFNIIYALPATEKKLCRIIVIYWFHEKLTVLKFYSYDAGDIQTELKFN
jgi:hypothetical protein